MLKGVPELDELCQFRSCYNIGENKGSFTPGRGYTCYYENPIAVCMTRMCHGCPSSKIVVKKSYGVCATRKIPDSEEMERSLYEEVQSAKCTNKVRNQMKEMLKIIKLQSEYVDAAEIQIKHLEEKMGG